MLFHWFRSMAKSFAREWQAILHDQGILMFFVVLPLMYPVIYTLIYNPEVVEDLPIAVVDNDRTAASRQLARDASAAPSIQIYTYAHNMHQAQELMAEGKVFGILEIPQGYGRNIGRMERANATFYSQMSLLIRYRAFMGAMTDVQLKTIDQIITDRAATLGAAGSALTDATPYNNEAHMLGDVQQGFASFIMPGILVLILQQSMVLGICMLGGTSRERRRRNSLGIDPHMIAGAPASAVVWGRTFCYTVFYIPATIFLMRYICVLFGMPHFGNPLDYLLFALPLVMSSAMFGQTLNYFVTDREASFMVVVFTSLVFLFLSGLTWPMYAMSDLWRAVGRAVPGVAGVEGFIRINSNAGTLHQNMAPWLWMWLLTVVYSVTATAVLHIVDRRARRRARSLPPLSA